MFELSYQEHKQQKNNNQIVYSMKDWQAECQSEYEKMKSGPHWHGGRPCRYVPECRYYKGESDV